MQRFWLMRFLWVCLLLAGITNTAFAAVGWYVDRAPYNTSRYSSASAACSAVAGQLGSTSPSSDQSCGTGSIVYCESAGWNIYAWVRCDMTCPAGRTFDAETMSCKCPAGKIEENGQCVDPPLGCQYPKEDDGQGGCKCPEGQIEEGETCKAKPDCTGKQAECLSSCTTQGKPLSRFYCEASTPSDPSTQLFSGESYHCACGTAEGCPTGQQQVISVTGSTSCAPNAADPNGCPVGSYYGDFNGQTGCIKPTDNSDPDESPNNCMTGTNAVYYGSTMYCVPPPDTTNCPTGTTPFITDTGLKICKGTDLQGNSTGDSPDTNGSIKGTPTSGSGSGGDGGGDGGDGSGTDTGTDNAVIAAKLDQIKANTDTTKASSAQTSANTQATANNTFKTEQNTAAIKDALTGPASTTAQGSFAESTAAIQAEVETLKTEYGATIADVKGQMTTFLSDLNTPTGTGGLPCYPSITIPVLNIPFALCFTQFEEALSIIGTYIYGIAFLFAGLIILGSTRGEG